MFWSKQLGCFEQDRNNRNKSRCRPSFGQRWRSEVDNETIVADVIEMFIDVCFKTVWFAKKRMDFKEVKLQVMLYLAAESLA